MTDINDTILDISPFSFHFVPLQTTPMSLAVFVIFNMAAILDFMDIIHVIYGDIHINFEPHVLDFL